MREIKFRAWDKVNKRWVQMGERIKIPCGTGYGEEGFVWDFITGFSPDGAFHINGENMNYIVSQYTGLHDKNGKEIYEGDIVSDATMKGLYEVKWSDEFSQVNCQSLLPSHYELSIHTLGEVEVIGNIYENPELLGK